MLSPLAVLPFCHLNFIFFGGQVQAFLWRKRLSEELILSKSSLEGPVCMPWAISWEVYAGLPAQKAKALPPQTPQATSA